MLLPFLDSCAIIIASSLIWVSEVACGGGKSCGSCVNQTKQTTFPCPPQLRDFPTMAEVNQSSTEEWALHLACFVDSLCRLSDQDVISAFTTLQSNYSLPLYTKILAANLRSSCSAYVVAAVLAQRLYHVAPRLFCANSAHKLFVGLIVLATKWSDDKCYKTPQFASVCGVSAKLLNVLERRILTFLDFALFVGEPEFQLYCVRLSELRTSTPAWRTENLPMDAVKVPVMRFHRSSKQSVEMRNLVAPRSNRISESSGEMPGVELPLKRTTTRLRWSAEEDCKLLGLVERFGQSWRLISEEMGTRDVKSCQTRWKNKLDPNINHQPFTAAEDDVLLSLISSMGNRWATISQHLEGRTALQCSNRFTTLKRKGAVPDMSTGAPIVSRMTLPHTTMVTAS